MNTQKNRNNLFSSRKSFEFNCIISKIKKNLDESSHIGEDHYIESGNKSYDFPKESLENEKISTPLENIKFHYTTKTNDPRFASISSQPNEFNDYKEKNNTITSKIYTILGSTYKVGKNVASTIKEKVNDMEITNKLYYAGGKTADILYNASYTIYEKGYEIAVINYIMF